MQLTNQVLNKEHHDALTVWALSMYRGFNRRDVENQLRKMRLVHDDLEGLSRSLITLWKAAGKTRFSSGRWMWVFHA